MNTQPDKRIFSFTEPISEEMISSLKQVDDIDELDITGHTRLFAAVAHESYEAVKILLELGAKPDYMPLEQMESNLVTAFIRTRQLNPETIKIIDLLINHGANVDLLNNDATPLMRVARYGSALSAKILLKAGADPHIKNWSGNTALVIAKKDLNTDVQEAINAHVLMLKRKEENEQLMGAFNNNTSSEPENNTLTPVIKNKRLRI